jgi:hypothetical protein
MAAGHHINAPPAGRFRKKGNSFSHSPSRTLGREAGAPLDQSCGK